MIDIKIPAIGESISEVTIAEWLKKDGDYVERDEVICELESEKASFELNAEQSGILHIKVGDGEDVEIGQVVAQIDETAEAPSGGGSEEKKEEAAESEEEEKEESGVKEENEQEESKQEEEQEQEQEEQKKEETAGKESSGKGIVEIKIPQIGESISEVTLLEWVKEEGAYVERDETLCELESEKASFEVLAEESGRLHQMAEADATLEIGQVVATIDTDVPAPDGKDQSAESAKEDTSKKESKEAKEETKEKQDDKKEETQKEAKSASASSVKATPVASAMMSDKKVHVEDVKGTGVHGKIVKNDVLKALENPGTSPSQKLFSRKERREKMSTLRRTISRRLVEAKNGTAMLTTFNEADMSKIKEIRAAYKKDFKEKHEVNLGFMSFFTKACCFALQDFPAVNAYLDGTDLIYHEYCDISIAVSTPRGLVVPVIRNAESLSMAGIEKAVVEIATKARKGKLTMEEMTGGTFTITNGGVFGSLMSTPIINPPQSAILGMHKIEDRPIVENGKVVVKPMMYLALSYDHRVIDGKESVSFLVRVKELLENPEQLLFGKDPVRTLLEM